MYQFTGFTQDDFNVFAIPEFHDRMSALRTRIRPKLAMIGDDLAPKLSDFLHHKIYPHTASHARRRVNPPDDTWVSFSRNQRGYKRFAHFEIGITLDYVFVRFVVKPEGEDDKPFLLRYLQDSGLESFRLLDSAAVYWYRDDHGVDPLPIAEITADLLPQIMRHTEIKSHGFTVGIILPKTDPVVGKAELISRAYNAIVHLSPLYIGTVPSEAFSK
ncbi:MAG TPA: DUF1054 domain-containing protein [Sulfobacillus sp.]|nr:DUF1054 domain-containing protein [Sulfobacillus sp.]